MTKEEVLTKVRKLFELSHSPNENEDALAAAKAREILSRYNLTMADLPSAEVKNAFEAVEKSVAVGRVVRNWVKGLLIHVANGFECEHIIRRRHGRDPILTFIGTSADAEVAVYTFQFLYRQIDGLAERALPRLKRENRGWSGSSLKFAYLDGAVQRIGERLQAQADSMRRTEQNCCKELVLVKEQLIEQYMRRTFSRIIKEYGRRRAVSATAFNKGYQDAAGITLRPATTKGESDRFALTG
jgi:hypothetical protein